MKEWVKSHYPQYERYIKSSKWRNIRQRVMARDGQRCKMCNSTENLQVHHLTYEHLYKEENYLYDLVTLCKKCHEKETNKGKQAHLIYKEIKRNKKKGKVQVCQTKKEKDKEKIEWAHARSKKINELDNFIRSIRKNLLKHKNLEEFEIIINDLKIIDEKVKGLGWND